MRSRLKNLIHVRTFECRCDEVKVSSEHSATGVTEEAFVAALVHTNVRRETRDSRPVCTLVNDLLGVVHKQQQAELIFTSGLLQIRSLPFVALHWLSITAGIFIISPRHRFHLHIPAAVTLNYLLME